MLDLSQALPNYTRIVVDWYSRLNPIDKAQLPKVFQQKLAIL